MAVIPNLRQNNSGIIEENICEMGEERDEIGKEDKMYQDCSDDKYERKPGRRKIKIEFINDKSRRHITFSKRKAGIMKKAYELSTLTGTQVLLLVASETGHVYTFATPKLQPLIVKPEGKRLIQTCLNTDMELQLMSMDPKESMGSNLFNEQYKCHNGMGYPILQYPGTHLNGGIDGNSSSGALNLTNGDAYGSINNINTTADANESENTNNSTNNDVNTKTDANQELSFEQNIGPINNCDIIVGSNVGSNNIHNTITGSDQDLIIKTNQKPNTNVCGSNLDINYSLNSSLCLNSNQNPSFKSTLNPSLNPDPNINLGHNTNSNSQLTQSSVQWGTRDQSASIKSNPLETNGVNHESNGDFTKSMNILADNDDPSPTSPRVVTQQKALRGNRMDKSINLESSLIHKKKDLIRTQELELEFSPNMDSEENSRQDQSPNRDQSVKNINLPNHTTAPVWQYQHSGPQHVVAATNSNTDKAVEHR